MTRDRRETEWNRQILVVYSVLAGVAIAQCLAWLTSPILTPGRLILLALVMYVVLDNWRSLAFESSCTDRGSWGDHLGLTMGAVISSTCIPFAFLAPGLRGVAAPPEVLLLNLAGLCLFDGLRRSYSLRRMRWQEDAPQPEREHVGTYIFLTISDFAHATMLTAGVIVLSRFHLDLGLGAMVVAITWIVVRVSDWLIVRSFATIFYRYMEPTQGSSSTLSGWWFEPIPGHIGPQDPAQPSQCRILAVDVVSSQIRPIEES
jgi:hypothetical protein